LVLPIRPFLETPIWDLERCSTKPIPYTDLLIVNGEAESAGNHAAQPLEVFGMRAEFTCERFH
jgi:hypothetical protein